MSDDVEPSPAQHDAPPRSEVVGEVDRRLDELDRKIDTVAGAMAAVATTQTELLEQGRQVLREVTEAASAQRADLALALEALAGVTEALERSATRTDDRLAAIRDAAAVPVADLQTLLTDFPGSRHEARVHRGARA